MVNESEGQSQNHDFPELLGYRHVGIGSFDDWIVVMGGMVAVVFAARTFGAAGILLGLVAWPALAAVVNQYRRHHPPNPDADLLDQDEDGGRELLKEAGEIYYEWWYLMRCRPNHERRTIYLLDHVRQQRDWERRYTRLLAGARNLNARQLERLKQLQSRHKMTESQ